MPQMQPCAVTDAVEVLLHPQHGIIREAFDEDREFWHRDVGINADNRLSFIQAWTRLRFASVTQVVDTLVEQYDSRATEASRLYPSTGRGQLVSCGTALQGEVGALCARVRLVRVSFHSKGKSDRECWLHRRASLRAECATKARCTRGAPRRPTPAGTRAAALPAGAGARQPRTAEPRALRLRPRRRPA